ncbi:hypothetical protein GCM10008015_03960 [Flavobacterium palustre]|uniref:GH16 domain-containing protein n=1 Tax=Flavobacterium palustre TaxID=1476463 RepID=A0ABQ1HAC8_9FLAO|nr:hypothetical protein [Flavobacterium palustre]GGA66466.1 hypothetical protein GCM10008015_03960 [Flavobacterium palustre]
MSKNKNIEFFCLVVIAILTLSCSSGSVNGSDTGDSDSNPVIENVLPQVQTIEVKNVTKTSASVDAKLIDNGSASIIRRGVCWNTTDNPTLENGESLNATTVKGSGEFSAELSNLKDGQIFYIRAFATSNAGTAYGEVKTFTTIRIPKPIVYLDSSCFDSKEKFDAEWNMLYPWGSDHNGSARMFAENVTLQTGGILQIKSEWTNWAWEGYSTAEPKLRITFHSGAIHAKDQIKVTSELPYWEISGDFKAPITPSSWPAFWITGAWSWPPEVDILEFKGTSSTLQNTVTGPAWNQTVWTSVLTAIPDAATTWHNYKLTMEKVSSTDVVVKMYIDGSLKTTATKDFVGKPFWLIMNMQMEGASGTTNDNSVVRTTPQYFQGKNIYVAATPKE